MGAELFRGDGRTDRHDVADLRFSQFLRSRLKITPIMSPLSTCILYGCLQRVTIPEAVVIQLVLLMMSSVLLETC